MSDDPQLTKRYVITAITSVFVLDPNLRGRYIRTDRSVIEVECPYCGAKIDEPCHNRGKLRKRYHSLTHTARRCAANSKRFRSRQ